MSSKARKRPPLRSIAEDVLRNISRGFVNPKENPDWVASIMRQWVSYQGHAALLTPTDRFWVETTRHATGYNVSVTHEPGSLLKGEWKIPANAVPKILADLNLLQVAEFKNRSGQQLRLWVDPQERKLNMEPAQ